MGVAAADAADPGGGDNLVPAIPLHLAEWTEASPTPHSPWKQKAASTTALVPVEGGEHGGGELILPALPPHLSDRTESPSEHPSPWRLKAAADVGEQNGILSDRIEDLPCSGAKEFEIDWGNYLANDAPMLILGEAERVAPAGPLLPLLAQAIECSASLLPSSSQPKGADVERQTNGVDADCQPEYALADPFDNEEEYVGVDDENMYDVTVPITITEQPEGPIIIEEDDNMNEAEVMQHINQKQVSKKEGDTYKKGDTRKEGDTGEEGDTRKEGDSSE